jgi:acyl-CoA thioesterase
MPTLSEVISPRALAPGRFALDVPDGWQQGRGAFGGLVLGAMLRAIERFTASPDRRPRTLMGELCGPVMPGAAEIAVEALRVGSGVSTVSARLLQDGEVQAHLVAVLGRSRGGAGPSFDGVARPAMPDWREVPVAAIEPPFGPPFAQHMEFRLASAPPFSKSDEARVAGWVRPRRPGEARDAAFVTALADAYFPGLLPTFGAPRPMATITFTLDLVGSCEGLDPDAPFFHEGRCLAARDGYAPELRTLWGEDGRLLAINHQTFVIIR